MSWAEIKKAVNSDLSIPLNTFIKNLITKNAPSLETGTEVVVYENSAEVNCAGYNTASITCVAKFIAPVSGRYKMQFDPVKNGSYYYPVALGKLANRGIIVPYNLAKTEMARSNFYAYVSSPQSVYANTAIGSAARTETSTSILYGYAASTTPDTTASTAMLPKHFLATLCDMFCNDTTSYSSADTITRYFNAEAGECVVIAGALNYNAANTSAKINNVRISYNKQD